MMVVSSLTSVAISLWLWELMTGPRTIGREWPATPGISGRYGVVFHTCDRLTVLRDEVPFNRGSLRKGIAGAVAKVMIPRH
jgi:hypothetical protein